MYVRIIRVFYLAYARMDRTTVWLTKITHRYNTLKITS